MGVWFGRVKLVVLSVFSFLGVLVAVFGVQGSAFGCDGVGTSGLVDKKVSPVLFDDSSLRKVGGRKYSVTELFGNSDVFSVPFGDYKGGFFRAENHVISDAFKDDLTADQKDKLKRLGEGFCFLPGVQPAFQSFMHGVSKGFAGLIAWFLQAFFNNQVICSDTVSSGCIDMFGIAAGKGGEGEGLIGALGKGVFIPLASLVFLATAVWFLWNALWKRQFRLGLQGVLWALFCFVLGVGTAVRPGVFMDVPQKVVSGVSACLLNSLNGAECIDGAQGEGLKKQKDQTCTAYGSVSGLGASSQFAMNSLSCSITKKFTIDRWASQQFGYSFDELYTVNSPTGKVYPASKLQGKPEDFCVSLSSSLSPEEMFVSGGSGVKTNRDVRVCNVALAYLANATVGDFGVKADMKQIVATSAKDDLMWSAMTGNGRDLLGFSSVLGMVALTISFIPMVVMGLAYSLMSSVLIIFAPLFLLMALHPGKGRKIFLGWLESVVSAVLKFFAIGLLLVVMVVMYSSVFSSTKGSMTLVASIIMAVVVVMYRKELTNLVGETSLGGVKVANKAKQAAEKRFDKLKGLGTAVAGGAIGGTLAGDGVQGIKEGLKTELRRGRGFVANTVRAGSQVGSKLDSEKKEALRQQESEAHRQQVLQSMEEQSARLMSGLQGARAGAESADERAQAEHVRANTLSKVDGFGSDFQVVNDAMSEVRARLSGAEAGEVKDVSASVNVSIEQARRVNEAFAQHGANSRGRDAYVESYRREQTGNIHSRADGLGLHGGERDEFVNRELGRLDEAVSRMASRFEVRNVGFGAAPRVTKLDLAGLGEDFVDFSKPAGGTEVG